jgi:hypothetical protein
VLADLVKIKKRIFQSATNGCHTTKCGTLELLALEQRLRILEKTNIVSGDSLDQMLSSRKLTEGNAEVIGIVEGVEKVLVERMDVLKSWEAVENQRDLLTEGLLGVLDFTGVEVYESDALV